MSTNPFCDFCWTGQAPGTIGIPQWWFPPSAKPSWFWLQEVLFVPEVSSIPEPSGMGAELGHPWALRHQPVLSRENAPSWHNLYRKEEGKKKHRKCCLFNKAGISDWSPKPPQRAPTAHARGDGTALTAAKPTCSASFPPFLIKTLPWYREALTKHHKACCCCCQGMIAASIYFSTIIFRVVLSRQTRSRSGACSTSSQDKSREALWLRNDSLLLLCSFQTLGGVLIYCQSVSAVNYSPPSSALLCRGNSGTFCSFLTSPREANRWADRGKGEVFSLPWITHPG